jgi:hypothetical protein
MNTLHPDLQRYRADLRDAIETDLKRQRSRRRTTTRVLRIGVPGVAVSLGLSLTLVLAGSQAAFAGWNPSPTSASAGQTPTADAACQATLRAAPPTSPGVAPGSGWSVVATDVRGPFTLVIYQNRGSGATCLTGPSITVVSQTTADGRTMTVGRSGTASENGGGLGAIRSSSVSSGSLFSSGSSGSVKHMTVTHLASTSQGAYTVVDGQIDEGVTGMTLALSDGEHVQATTGNGWFVAWWPGSVDVTSAEITTASGVTTQTLTLNTPPNGADNT